MSEKLPQHNQNEEVDLGQLFNLIGDVFNKLFKFIGSLFNAVYSVFIKIFRDIFLNIKLIVLVLGVTLIAGFVLDEVLGDTFYSEMIVVPHFDSKYDLINNISYFNSLVKTKDYKELTNHFNLEEKELRGLKKFEIEIGPESKNENIKAFNEFTKGLDSLARLEVTFETYTEQRNIYNASTFLIRARSKNRNVFKKLEAGLLKSLDRNTLSEEKKAERDSLLMLEKQTIKVALEETRLLKATYLEVLETESKKNTVASTLESSLGLQVQKTETKENQLLDKELALLDRLNAIEKQRVAEDTVYDSLVNFTPKGILESVWYKKFIIILPILGFLLLGLYVYIFRFYRYTMNYK